MATQYESLLSDSSYTIRETEGGERAPPVSDLPRSADAVERESEVEFCERTCQHYFAAYVILLTFLFLLCFGIVITIAPVGLVCAAIVPGVVTLLLTRRYYEAQVTTGQILVCFFECILWMVPLLIWDTVLWSVLLAPEMKEDGLCALCILAYVMNFYFFAGFCEEFIKYLVMRRIETSVLTEDWRAMMVYGIAAGCGFATAENIMYVLSGGFVTAIVRGLLSVPLHCTTGAIIGVAVAKGRTESNRAAWWKVLFVPWLVHGSYDFLLTISEQPRTGPYAVLSYFGAILFFFFGLYYARKKAVEMSLLFPDAGDVHRLIFYSEPSILGMDGISQWGSTSNFVCQCCLLCKCCCRSRAMTRGNVTGKQRFDRMGSEGSEPLLL